MQPGLRKAFDRYDEGTVFRNLELHGRSFEPAEFAGRELYMLTDLPDRFLARRDLGKRIETLDGLSDAQVANGVFYTAFTCDSDALPHVTRIIECEGVMVPHLQFSKAPYRFTDRMCWNALWNTFSRADELAHLSLAVHENICEALNMTRHIAGHYVEVGVYKGGSAFSALNYQRQLLETGDALTRPFWFFDTFSGFSYEAAASSADAVWSNTHRLAATEKWMSDVNGLLRAAVVPYRLEELEICGQNLPGEIDQIAVANVDVDLLEATEAALTKIAPRIVQGGIILCEDSSSTPGLYGAYYALEKFLASPLGSRFRKIYKGGHYFLIRDRPTSLRATTDAVSRRVASVRAVGAKAVRR